MATGVPFFDIYLKSLIDPATTQNALSKQSKLKPNRYLVAPLSISHGYKFTRNVANSIRSSPESTSTSPIDKNTNSRYLRLPPEIWLIILQHLPLSQIPELNLVCRRLFCIVRFKSCFWLLARKAMHPSSLDLMPVLDGATPFEYLTKLEWMAYTKVKQSFGMACDFCYQGGDSSANKHGSSAVLRVLSPYNTTSLRKRHLYLCLPCRQRHYRAYPEPMPALHPLLDKPNSLPYADAIPKYCLPKSSQPEEPKESSILEGDAVAIGRRVHGGDVGIQAERLRLASGGFEGPAILPRKYG